MTDRASRFIAHFLCSHTIEVIAGYYWVFGTLSVTAVYHNFTYGQQRLFRDTGCVPPYSMPIPLIISFRVRDPILLHPCLMQHDHSRGYSTRVTHWEYVLAARSKASGIPNPRSFILRSRSCA